MDVHLFWKAVFKAKVGYIKSWKKLKSSSSNLVTITDLKRSKKMDKHLEQLERKFKKLAI